MEETTEMNDIYTTELLGLGVTFGQLKNLLLLASMGTRR